VLVRSVITGALGQYHFDNLLPGGYFVRVLPPASLPIPGGNPVDEDNGIDRDNNGYHQPGGPGTAVYTPVIELVEGEEPTVDDNDADTDYTVDVALFRGMNVGNHVWHDVNDNGLRDAGEPGINGVQLQLWSTGADGMVGGTDDMLAGTTTTANVAASGDGSYTFAALPPGRVYVRIPVPPAAYPLSSSTTTVIDNGVNDDDNGIQVGGGAIYSPAVLLTPGVEPGTAGGTSVESTIDFGLLSVTPSIYVSATHDDSIQVFDSTSGSYHGDLISKFGTSHSQGNADRCTGCRSCASFRSPSSRSCAIRRIHLGRRADSPAPVACTMGSTNRPETAWRSVSIRR
jgi:hypothetical protein